jgi:hypothetical protein
MKQAIRHKVNDLLKEKTETYKAKIWEEVDEDKKMSLYMSYAM